MRNAMTAGACATWLVGGYLLAGEIPAAAAYTLSALVAGIAVLVAQAIYEEHA